MSLIQIKDPSAKPTKKLCLGIDFGTTNSVCSIKLNNGFEFILDSMGKTLIPTIILYDKKKIYGNEAFADKNYLKSIFSVKRNFTKDFITKKFKDEKNNKISSIDVSKDFFIYLKELCESYLKQKVYDCVITVPAYFDERARSGIMKAAFMAGLRVK